MQFGSFFNGLYANAKGTPEPAVGMGATMLYWSDRHAATIVEVKGKVVVVQQDHAKRVDGNGMSDSQAYEYAPNPAAPKVAFSLRKDGQYVQVGHDMKSGTALLIGDRREYYDFSF